MIEFDLDQYGKFARFSNIADLLELRVIAGGTVRKGRVEDWLGDLDVNPSKDLLIEEGELDQAEAVNLVFDVLAERQAVLKDQYPFALDGNSLKARPASSGFYEQLLTMTVAHAHRISIGTKTTPDMLFEKVVTQAFNDRGWLAVCVGEGRVKFKETLGKCGKKVKLATNPDAAVHSRFANDEGVDVLAHFHLYDDERDTRVILVGQATIEKSDGWEKKASQVKPKRWQKYLKTQLRPMQFFAVPHHVESREFSRIVESIDCLVLDRLRLVLMLEKPFMGTKALLKAVRRQQVELWA